MPSRTSCSSGSGLSPSRSTRLHDHSGRAEAALQGVALVERLLHRVQLPVAGEALDGGDLAAVGLDGEHRARLHALPVEVDGAGAAVAGVAPDDGSGLPEPFPQVVDQEHAGFDLVDVVDAVDGDPDLCHEPFLLGRDRDGAGHRRAAPDFGGSAEAQRQRAAPLWRRPHSIADLRPGQGGALRRRRTTASTLREPRSGTQVTAARGAAAAKQSA